MFVDRREIAIVKLPRQGREQSPKRLGRKLAGVRVRKRPDAFENVDEYSHELDGVREPAARIFAEETPNAALPGDRLLGQGIERTRRFGVAETIFESALAMRDRLRVIQVR